MGIITSLISPPTSLSVPPAVLAPPATDLVSTRLTAAAVPAPLTTLSANNDASGTAKLPLNTNAQASAAASQPSSASADTGGSSTLFLTQLLGQSDNVGTVALATSFAQFSPAPTYDTLVGYSFIKYKPSYAGLPQPDLVQSASSQEDSPAPPSQANIAAASAARDFQAYSDTQSRNQSNLAASASQLAIAG